MSSPKDPVVGCWSPHSEKPTSMGWLKGKSTGNHAFSYEILDVPVIIPLNQSIDTTIDSKMMWSKPAQPPKVTVTPSSNGCDLSCDQATCAGNRPVAVVGTPWSLPGMAAEFPAVSGSSRPWNNRGEMRGLPATWFILILFGRDSTNWKEMSKTSKTWLTRLFACNMANIKSVVGHYLECRCQGVLPFLGVDIE